MEKIDNKKVYSELYEIFNILGKDYTDKIPKKLYRLIDKVRDKDYTPNLLKQDGSFMLDESKIDRKTIALFGIINIKYFVTDEEEKRRLMSIYNENEINYQKELKLKYNADNIFNKKNISNKENVDSISQSVALATVKENIFTKIINKIRSFFFKKK